MSTVPARSRSSRSTTATRSRSSASASSRSRPTDTAQAVSTAFEVGYRHIDTAEMYRNERGVGEALRASGLDRAEVFITSKLNNGFHSPDDARRAFDHTLVGARLGLRRPVPRSTGRCRRSTTATTSRPGRRWRSSSSDGPRALDRRLQLPGRAPGAAGRRDRRDARGQPDRAPPLPPQRRGPRATARSTASSPRRGRRSPRAACSTIR